MEKGKRIETEFQFPEAIIQHIQSFLTGKEAAQTTLLSKSWYTAWLTRPNLDFDQNDFVRKSRHNDTHRSEIRFIKFVKKTVERYDKLNLKIDSLRLWIHASHDAKHYTYSLANKLIVKALKMGANGLDFKIFDNGFAFDLPHEVFGSENLIRLSVSGCKIGNGVNGKVSCSGLKSLILDNVRLKGDIIFDIISSCPLIENLSLCTSSKLVSSPFTEFGKRNVGSAVGGPVIVNVFRKLKRLLLYRVNVHTLYFDDFSSKFPCLKDFGLYHCDGYKAIEISSPSLECISFTQDEFLTVSFDVPSIRRFTFSGSRVPLLSFKTTTTSNWQSDISIKRRSPPSAAWFLELNKLLKKLCLSKVSLSLEILSEKSLDYERLSSLKASTRRKFRGLPKPEVENLTIKRPYSVCPAIFYGLLQCCRPVYITQHWFPKSCIGKKNYDFMEFVYERMMQQVTLNCCIAYQRMSGRHCDLEELIVEFYDEAVSAWRPQLLDASTSLAADQRRMRVHLRWRR